jgi:hypothetical protein
VSIVRQSSYSNLACWLYEPIFFIIAFSKSISHMLEFRNLDPLYFPSPIIGNWALAYSVFH